VSLTSKDVDEIARLLEDSSFTELRLELDGMKLWLRRGGSEPAVAAQPAAASEPAPAAGTIGSAASGAAVSRGHGDPPLHEVLAPLLGTFYRAPKPGAAPFVSQGASVEADTVIGIIEVMKLMNAVRAGARGNVTEILAADGTLVEYGQPLLRIRTSG
jgi:acetyl-CoA carboxylase biotin carboxyl carrier protein